MAAILTARELLQREVATLPEELAEEVIDFLMFVKTRRAEEAFLWKQAEAAEAYQRDHPEEVITATAEEWMKVAAPKSEH